MTFDGVIATNGVQPLWFILVAAAVKCFGTSSAFFFAISCLIAALNFLSFRLARRLAFETGASKETCRNVSFFVLSACLWLTSDGMEIALAIPALMTLCIAWVKWTEATKRQTVLLGLLTSLVGLSRIDTLIVIPFLLATWLDKPFSWHELGGRLGLYLLGTTPFLVYCIGNFICFDILIPISGVAKQLKPLLPIGPFPQLAFSTGLTMEKVAFVHLVLLSDILTLLLVFCKKAQQTKPMQKMIVALSCYIPTFYFIQAVCSDWMLWQWYFYPVVVISPVTIAITMSQIERICTKGRLPKIGTRSALRLCLVYLLGWVVRNNLYPGRNPIWEAAKILADFSRTHHGRFAMGDRAGTFAYLTDQPVIQLEGLVEDKKYVSNIRQQRNLTSVLKEYRITYYIATNPAIVDGCYVSSEPARAGLMSPHMTGRFCTQPTFSFDLPDLYWGTVHTRVFQVDCKSASNWDPSPGL